MKKNKLLTILKWMQILWAIIFLVDFILFAVVSRPVFVLPFHGGEITSYYGLGYAFHEVTPLVSAEDAAVYASALYEVYLFFVIQGILLLLQLLFYLGRKKRS